MKLQIAENNYEYIKLLNYNENIMIL